ncbi:MAG: hypothetical protein GX174_14435 [Lentisphaerae bacterium]|jgi:hypothetical protein|nr:hypothetical protein [Lentisphaerota bacterium]
MASKIQNLLLAIAAIPLLHTCSVCGQTGPRAQMDMIPENIGLAVSTNALASVYVGTQLLASTNLAETAIGGRVVWHIPWSKARTKTIRAVVTDPDDIRLPNNSLEIEFRARWKRGMLMMISRLGEKEEGERQGMGEG